MTKPQWEIELNPSQFLVFDKQSGSRFIDNEKLMSFIRSQIEKSYQQGVEDMRRKCVEELKEYHTENPQDDVDRFGNGIINNVTKTITRYKPN